MIPIKRLEKKYIPNLRKKKGYVIIRNILLMPIMLIVHCITITVKKAISKMVIGRKDKPDIILKNIVDGWINLAFPNKEVEVLARGRAAICAECPFAVTYSGVYTIQVDGKPKNMRGMKCNKCGCPLSAKVRSPNDHCPIGLW